jgi:hypothetical protein
MKVCCAGRTQDWTRRTEGRVLHEALVGEADQSEIGRGRMPRALWANEVAPSIIQYWVMLLTYLQIYGSVGGRQVYSNVVSRSI